jgi:hypothetical protein
MDREIEMEVFRAGDYGPRGTYSEDDLEQVASDYAPERHEAPVTVDHQQDGPALGWVRGLRRAGRLLLARLGGLDAGFLQKLKAGAFKKRSVEIYRKLEATGRPYLRALTFLGAGAPVVKGLADPVFGERPEAATETNENHAWIAFDETVQSEMTEASPTASANEERNADDSRVPRTAAFVEADAATERFCEELRKEGRLLPVWEEKGIGRFLCALDDANEFSFSGTPNAPKLTARAWFREFLKSLAPAVPMGEIAPDTSNSLIAFRDAANGVPAAIPENWHGARLDEASMALHQRVCRYRQARPGAGYAEALQAVFAEGR